VYCHLYDNEQIKQPKLDGKDETFDKVDSVVLEALTKAQAENKKIVVLSHSYPSPTFKKLFGEFKAKYSNAELVTYDAYTYAAALDCKKFSVIEHYQFTTYQLLN
jgi:molybdopterin-containing oxidoreductase family iron-sulfur binding subunit